MSSRIVAAVPYQRGHSDSRSKSGKRDYPSTGIDPKQIKTIEAPSQASKPLIGGFSVPNTLNGGIHVPFGVGSQSNILPNKPGEFQRRIS
jgi:hypothetical protein